MNVPANRRNVAATRNWRPGAARAVAANRRNGDGSISTGAAHMEFTSALSGNCGPVVSILRVDTAKVVPALSSAIELAIASGRQFSARARQFSARARQFSAVP